jgi:hypothetical protein
MRKIVFIAEYEDGSKRHFEIDRTTLRGGDLVATMVARECQDDGRLPLGKIVRVYRDPAISYLD